MLGEKRRERWGWNSKLHRWLLLMMLVLSFGVAARRTGRHGYAHGHAYGDAVHAVR